MEASYQSDVYNRNIWRMHGTLWSWRCCPSWATCSIISRSCSLSTAGIWQSNCKVGGGNILCFIHILFSWSFLTFKGTNLVILFLPSWQICLSVFFFAISLTTMLKSEFQAKNTLIFSCQYFFSEWWSEWHSQWLPCGHCFLLMTTRWAYYQSLLPCSWVLIQMDILTSRGQGSSVPPDLAWSSFTSCQLASCNFAGHTCHCCNEPYQCPKIWLFGG